MKAKQWFNSLQLSTAALLALGLLIFAACASVPMTDSTLKTVNSESLTFCTEPRPQICTMDYQPVCAELKDGRSKTYSNGCSSCSDANVVGYHDGECAVAK